MEKGIEEGTKGLEDYSRLASEISDLFYRFVRERLKPYALETSETGIEFLAFITLDGEAIILEGEEDRVQAPVKDAIAEVHTHPGICLPSSQDLRSAWRLFSMGLSVFSVYSVECYFSLSLVGPYTEEDYVKLLSLSREIGKVKTVEDYMSTVKRYSFEGIRLSLLPP